MRIQEASSTAADNPEESALSGWFRGGSTPRGMSAIRINVEEASNASREDFVRDVSPLIMPDDVRRLIYVAKARGPRRITRKSRVCGGSSPSSPPAPPPGFLSVVGFLFHRFFRNSDGSCRCSSPISDLRHGIHNLAGPRGTFTVARQTLRHDSPPGNARRHKGARERNCGERINGANGLRMA